MASSGGTALYAELLANIRQISLAASLPSPSDTSTVVSMASDGRTVELKHGNGAASQLTLPARAALGGTVLPVADRQRGAPVLTWRLPVDAASLPPPHQDAHTPLSASDLDPSSGVTCRHCNADVVPSGAVRAWKDLPSENWAEMMEFWHCHKPDHHHHHHGEGQESGKADEASLAARGYGASSVISAQEGVVFVDLTTMLFAETDCRNVTFSLLDYAQGSTERQNLPLTESSITPTRSLNVFCCSCHTQLGFFNFRTSAVTLLKWQVLCNSASGSAPNIPECLAATLISTMARSGSSKSLVMPIPETTQESDGHAIHIWVLNSSIVYSTSRAPQSIPAVKLLFRLIRREDADRMLETINCDAQEISLPAHALNEVIRHLEDSNALLPPPERVFKEWKVGLLTRWEIKV